MLLSNNQHVTLVDNHSIDAVPPVIGEQGHVVAVVDMRALVVFNDGTTAWFKAADDERLATTQALVLDLSTWGDDTTMLIDQFCAEASIHRRQAIRELVSAGLEHLGWTRP
jgi:hypothetical protein